MGKGRNITAKEEGERKSKRHKTIKMIRGMKTKSKTSSWSLRPNSRKPGKWEGRGDGKL